MNEARLKIIDKYLHKGWCSYLDIAKAINDAIKDNEINPYGIKKFRSSNRNTYDSYNKQLIEWFRGSIGQDFMDIPEIWALANEGRILIRDGQKSSKEDQKYRSKIRNQLIEEELRPQYILFSAKNQKNDDDTIEDLRRNRDGNIDVKKVRFYRYKNRNYSLFDSGDYKNYQERKLKLKFKNQLANATETVISEEDVKNVLYESDVILEPTVSEKIKQSIRLRDELKEYEDEVKSIISDLQSSITSVGEEKRRGWIKKTINYYKNILEVAKSPISNIDKREVANHIHNFALFLASENQYQMLGDRFEEAIGIYQKLVLIQKHSLDDYLAGEELFVNEKFCPQEVQNQMQLDKELVAEALLHFARVQFDSHNTDYAISVLEKALSIANTESSLRARLLQLRSIIFSVSGNFDTASDDIEEAYKCAISSGMDEMDLSEIVLSQAELLRAKGNLQEAKEKYSDTIFIYRRKNPVGEGLASALMSMSMLHLSIGEIENAETTISESQSIFDNLYTKEPDKFLPSLMSAKYLKMIVVAQKGDINNAIDIGESVLAAFSVANETLKTLCVQESLQTLLYLKELYFISGNGEGVAASVKKFEGIKEQYNNIIDPIILDATDTVSKKEDR